MLSGESMAAIDYDRERSAAPSERIADHEDRVSGPTQLASSVGNAAFSAIIGRVGAGILPDGTAHPDVEQTIARTRGGGQTLSPGVRERASTHLSDPLSDVRVHSDDTADGLAQSVSARAFTTGSDVYFARGEYAPGTTSGDTLLTHELAHVVQQRGAPTSGPLVVSQPGDALETEAETVASDFDG
jgi:hypothetical protein